MTFKTVMAVGALALLGACSTAPKAADITPVEKVADALNADNATMLQARGYYDQAAIAYRAGLKTNPDDYVARFGLAESERLAGRIDAAKEDYQLLLEVDEWKIRATEGLARVAFLNGDRAGAFNKFTAVVSEDPNAWRSWLGLAQLHDLDKQWAEADQAYALALAATKEPATVYNNHGISMMARGQPAAAIELFRSAIAADPKMARALTNLDLAQAATGQQVALDVSDGDARERARKLNNYGYVAMLQDRPEDARRYYEAAIKEFPSFYALAFDNLKTLERSNGKPQQ